MEKLKLEVGQIAAESLEYGQPRPALNYQLVTLTHNDTCIHDPRFDESGIGQVDPSYYGATAEQVNQIIQANGALILKQNDFRDAIDFHIDEATATIQSALKIKSGDLAAHHFSSDDSIFEIEKAFGERIAKYAIAEIEFNEPDLKKTRQQSRASGPSM